MNQPSSDGQSQIQDNIVRDTKVSGDFIFAPVQIGTKIETQIVEISVAKVTQRQLIKASPYQGLKRFNFKDRDRFFGRDKLIARLFEAVNRSSLSLVLGASGSGKSSAVRAGLIPELKKSLESSKFYDFIFTPHEDPFESLYRCLLNEEKDYSFSKSEAEIALKAEVDTLAKIIKKLKKDDERWLIFVDQFEELFTSCHDLDKRNNFIASLVRVANSGDNSVKIMLAMRADFLEQLSSYPALGAIANENNIHLVTDMHPDELRQVIEQPAAKHGVVFEEGLVEQIIEEVEGQKGYLPLLQYTLDLLWQIECRTVGADENYKIENRTLNQTSYAALEGVRGALQKRVNEIYNNLNQDEQSATKQIFVKLVNIVDTEFGSKTVSRRANRSEFVGELINNTLQIFIDKNLLVSSAEVLSSEELQVSKSLKQSATVEIAHEILLSSWDKLKCWIEQEKEAIILKNWLAGETKRWQKIRVEDKSKAREELLKGSRLEQVVEFRKKDAFQNIGGLRAEENEFIDVSVAEIERLAKEKEDQQQRELKLIRERLEQEQKALEQAKKALTATRRAIFAFLTSAFVIFGAIVLARNFARQSLDNIAKNRGVPIEDFSVIQKIQDSAEEYERNRDVDNALIYYGRIRENAVAWLEKKLLQKEIEIDQFYQLATQKKQDLSQELQELLNNQDEIVVYKLYDQETGEWNQILSGESDSYENKPPQKNDRLINLNQFLWIPGNGSWATFSYLSDDNNKQYLGVAAGPSKNKEAATYRFPCQFTGGTNVIGWSEGMPDEGEMCAIQGVEISLEENIASSGIFLEPLTQKSIFTTRKFITQASEYSNALIRYCTVAAKDKGWWVSRGTSNQPCRDAYQQCLNSGGADGCKVLSLGDWRIRDKDLLVNISCEDNRIYQRRGSGKEILDNLLIEASQAIADRSRMCILNVYRPNSLIVSPDSKQATLIQTHADNRGIVIEALVGGVIISSAQDPNGKRESLKAGNRYIYPSDIFEPIDVAQVVADSPAVQNFFDSTNWFPGAEKQLAQYSENLGQPSDDPEPVSSNSENPSTNEKDSNLLEKIAPALIPIALAGLIDVLSNDNDNNNNDSQNNNKPLIRFDSANLDFGTFMVGLVGREPTETVTLTNNGSAPLKINNVTINDETITVDSITSATNGIFTVSENTCTSEPLNSGRSCAITIKFTPSKPGEFNGKLTIFSNAANNQQSISLSGSGSEYVLQ